MKATERRKAIVNLLLSKEEADAVWTLRRNMNAQNTYDTMAKMLTFMKETDNNNELIQRILKYYKN